MGGPRRSVAPPLGLAALLLTSSCGSQPTPTKPGLGSAAVSVAFNQPPTILVVTANPTQISSLAPTDGVLTVAASDPDGDQLGYVWSVDPASACAATLATPGEATTSFSAVPTAPTAGACTFLVTVDDGVWPGTTFFRNRATAALTLAITLPLVVEVPPSFGIAYQSDDTIAAGGTFVFGTIAHDSAGGDLDFAWSASTGDPPATTDPAQAGLKAFTSVATWTAPGDAAGYAVVSVSARNSATGLAGTRSFLLAPAANR